MIPIFHQYTQILHHSWQGITAYQEHMYIDVNDPSLNGNFGKYQLHTYGMKFYRTHQSLQLK